MAKPIPCSSRISQIQTFKRCNTKIQKHEFIYSFTNKKSSSLEIIPRFPTFPHKFIVFSKKGLHCELIAFFPIFVPKSWCSLQNKGHRMKLFSDFPYNFSIFEKVQRVAVWPPLEYRLQFFN